MAIAPSEGGLTEQLKGYSLGNRCCSSYIFVLFLVTYVCSHCRFVKAYRAHTVTSRPKVIPGKIFSRPRQRLWIKIADFPFRHPITCATPYLGRYSSSYGYNRTSHALSPTLCQTDCTILETDFLFLLEFFQIALFTIC